MRGGLARLLDKLGVYDVLEAEDGGAENRLGYLEQYSSAIWATVLVQISENCLFLIRLG